MQITIEGGMNWSTLFGSSEDLTMAVHRLREEYGYFRTRHGDEDEDQIQVHLPGHMSGEMHATLSRCRECGTQHGENSSCYVNLCAECGKVHEENTSCF